MMKNFRRVLSLVMIIVFVAISIRIPAQAEVPDNKLLAAFQPKVVKLQKQCPAEVTLTIADGTLTFKGTAGTKAVLSEAETLQAIRDAVKAVPEYSSVDDAYADVMLVRELTGELEFGSKDIERIQNNLAKILGLKSLKNLLDAFSDELPDLTWEDDREAVEAAQNESSWKDAAKTAKDAYKTGKALKKAAKAFKNLARGRGIGVPSTAKIIIHGFEVSYEEFKRDQKKYADMVELLNAKERLRRFQNAVSLALYDRMKPVFVIDVGGTKAGNAYVGSGYQCPARYSLQLVVYKDDGKPYYEGSYSGTMILNVDVDTEEFDAGYGQRWADMLNGLRKAEDDRIQGIVGRRPSDDLLYQVVDNGGAPSSVYTHYKSDSFKLTVPNRNAAGQSVVQLDPMQLYVADMDNFLDRHMTVRAENDVIMHELTISDCMNKNGDYFYEDYSLSREKIPPYKEYVGDNPETGTLPQIDTRPYLNIVLTIDGKNSQGEDTFKRGN